MTVKHCAKIGVIAFKDWNAVDCMINGYNLGCFNFGKTICGAEGLDEIDFVHGIPFFGNCSWLDK